MLTFHISPYSNSDAHAHHSYAIALTPDLDKFTYEGTTTVSVNVIEVRT